MSIPTHTTHTSTAAKHVPQPPAAPGGCSIAFPSSGHAEDEHEPAAEYWDGRSAKPAHRTVRRKKSSFDLRHVFKTGGIIPNAPATSVSVL